MSCEAQNEENAQDAHNEDDERPRKRSKRQSKRMLLRELLLGPPLNNRPAQSEKTTDAHLNSWMRALRDFILKVGGESEAAKQAAMEFEQFESFPATQDGLMCKRAALLFAVLHEREVAAKMHGPGVDDLVNRVLPITCPRYLRHSCQCPDTFVVLTLILSEMWSGERLGNWPRAPQ